MSEPVKKKCLPCALQKAVLEKKEAVSLYKELEDGWQMIEGKRIEKEYLFKNFKEALAFVNDIGKVAEEEGHHPDIELGWGRVKISLHTHKLQGLSTSDFILADKCDALFTSRVK